MLSPLASHSAESHRTTLNVNFADALCAMNPAFIAHRSLQENSRSIANKTRTGLWFAKIESGGMAHLHALCKSGNSSKSASGAFGWRSGSLRLSGCLWVAQRFTAAIMWIERRLQPLRYRLVGNDTSMIRKIKALAPWLTGLATETFWDSCPRRKV